MKEKLKIQTIVTKVSSEKVPNLKALASIIIGGIKIDNIKIIKRMYEKAGKKEIGTFVEFPKQKRQDKEGNIVYKNIVTFRGKDDEETKKIQNFIKNTILQGYKLEEKTTKVMRESDFTYNDEYIKANIDPTPNSDKILGVGLILYGGIMEIQPVFLKAFVNKITNEPFKTINFEQIQDKEGNYKEIVYPIKEGLRSKIRDAVEEAISIESNEKFTSIEESEFYKELEEEANLYSYDEVEKDDDITEKIIDQYLKENNITSFMDFGADQDEGLYHFSYLILDILDRLGINDVNVYCEDGVSDGKYDVNITFNNIPKYKMELRAWHETDSFKEDVRDLIKYYNQRKERQNEKEEMNIR